jgi:hypothetical protein
VSKKVRLVISGSNFELSTYDCSRPPHGVAHTPLELADESAEILAATWRRKENSGTDGARNEAGKELQGSMDP